jgi:L-aspartate oxidase
MNRPSPSSTIAFTKPQQSPTLIIGAGMAGLTLACLLAETGQSVTVVSKTASWAETAIETNSAYAQGGMAVCLPTQNPRGDSFPQHQADTLSASGGFANTQAIETLLAQAPELVATLQRWGVVFDATPTGELAFTQEAAHQTRRVIHAGGDATGKHLVAGLLAYAKTLPYLHFKPDLQLLRFIQQASGQPVQGALFFNEQTQQIEPLYAEQTILATGGLAGLYTHTTNPPYTTGEALSIAQEAGCSLKDMAFIQFHPTAFYWQGQVKFLVSEALRGEGGVLKNKQGEAFAKRYHTAGELAPRDVVSRMIYEELHKTSPPATNVWLDMTHLSADFLVNRFPTIYKKALAFGVDFTTMPLPVAPAAHYTMGGIQTTPDGQTGIQNLWAIGECACTGLHGANRLASNSLLECGAMALEAFKTIQANQQPMAKNTLTAFMNNNDKQDAWVLADAEIIAQILPLQTALKQLMWQQVGVIRTVEGLQQAKVQLERWVQQATKADWQLVLPEGLNYYHQLQVASAVVEKALALPQSVGSHYLRR